MDLSKRHELHYDQWEPLFSGTTHLTFCLWVLDIIKEETHYRIIDNF